MTSDSITEQAARAVTPARRREALGVMERAMLDCWTDEHEYAHAPEAILEALIAHGLLAHQAPATEDEAAEVEWARAFRTNDGLFVDDNEGAFCDAEDVAAFVKPQNPESPYDLIVSRTVGPWREVSR